VEKVSDTSSDTAVRVAEPGMMCAVPAAATRDARRALLGASIDHAALFPPASMSMSDALQEDGRVRAAPEAWLVRRFVVPASRLDELGDAQVPLSLVLDAPYDGADERIEAVEAPPGVDPAAVAWLAPEVYVELPADLERLRTLGLRAKVRCGGVRVPSVDELADVVRSCRELGLVVKATAGLHHAVRTNGEHGFLNLLAAAVFGDEPTALAESSADAFALDERAFRWRDRIADAVEVAHVRRELFAGFGSCSVAEPADELRALGIL
jgi:hypothetical protein